MVLPNDKRVIRPLSVGIEASNTEEAASPKVRDSKQLTYAQRDAADRTIRALALAVGVGIVPPNIVDEVGLSFAGQLAFWRAVSALPIVPQHLLVDGFPLWSPRFPQTALLQGDAHCLSIAAASVVAKVARDRFMADLDAEHPGYGFSHNRGYGTREHAGALRELGPSVHHRRSFAPVVASLAEATQIDA